MRISLLVLLAAALSTARSMGADQQNPPKPAVVEKASGRTPKPKPVDPPLSAELDRAIERGVAFLLKVQNPNAPSQQACEKCDLVPPR